MADNTTPENKAVPFDQRIKKAFELSETAFKRGEMPPKYPVKPNERVSLVEAILKDEEQLEKQAVLAAQAAELAGGAVKEAASKVAEGLKSNLVQEGNGKNHSQQSHTEQIQHSRNGNPEQNRR